MSKLDDMIKDIAELHTALSWSEDEIYGLTQDECCVIAHDILAFLQKLKRSLE